VDSFHVNPLSLETGQRETTDTIFNRAVNATNFPVVQKPTRNTAMKNKLIAWYIFFGILVSSPGFATDYPSAHVASPDHYRVLLENEHVIVLKMVIGPGEADVMHSHQNETVYFERGGQLKITDASGEIIEADILDGHVMWHKAWSHQVTNTGDSDVIAIIVEEKL
jgi:hypothetical protein